MLTMGDNAGQLGSITLGVDQLGSGFPDKPKVVYGDVRLQGYDAHTSLIIRNNDSNEPFVFRHVQLAYKPLGLKRRRQAGIE